MKSVPSVFIRSIESENARFLREFIEINARAKILGLRYPLIYCEENLLGWETCLQPRKWVTWDLH